MSLQFPVLIASSAVSPMKQNSQKNIWKMSCNLQMWNKFIIGIIFASKVFCEEQEKF